MEYIKILNIIFIIALIYILYDIFISIKRTYKRFKSIKIGDIYYFYEFPNATLPIVITKKTKWYIYYIPSVISLDKSYKPIEYKCFFYWFIITSSKIK